MSPALSIIIVNYRTPQLVVDCLHTVFGQWTGDVPEVLVVDNASGDNSREIILSHFPQVRWIQMSYNSGFARANNEGIRESGGDTILLLNSDTLNRENAVQRCFNDFRASPHLACGVQLLNRDETPQISGNYFMKGGLNNLLPLPYLGKMIRALGNFIKVKKPNIPDASSEIEVDWINGAFLMVKRSVIDKVGLLDGDFFLYAEEAEWCARIRKQGSLCIYGQYHVVHLQGESANKTFESRSTGYYNLYDRKGLQIMLSNFVRIRKQFGVGWFFLHLAIYFLAVPVYFLVSFIENLFRFGNPFKEYGAATAFGGNMLRLLSYTGKIISNKPYFYKVL